MPRWPSQLGGSSSPRPGGEETCLAAVGDIQAENASSQAEDKNWREYRIVVYTSCIYHGGQKTV